MCAQPGAAQPRPGGNCSSAVLKIPHGEGGGRRRESERTSEGGRCAPLGSGSGCGRAWQHPHPRAPLSPSPSPSLSSAESRGARGELPSQNPGLDLGPAPWSKTHPAMRATNHRRGSRRGWARGKVGTDPPAQRTLPATPGPCCCLEPGGPSWKEELKERRAWYRD